MLWAAPATCYLLPSTVPSCPTPVPTFAKVNVRNRHRETPLLLAVRAGSTDAVTALLASGARLDEADDSGEILLDPSCVLVCYAERGVINDGDIASECREGEEGLFPCYVFHRHKKKRSAGSFIL